MAINPDLLVAAPMLQNYLVNKDGTPLSGGIVTLWVDTARYTQLKNWYFQTGVPGNYTYIPLPNPLELSAAGTIQDGNGNDVIPFYYPFDENDENIPQAYFITVFSVDSNGNPDVLQFTRENFPFMPSGGPIVSDNPTFRNYILNNVYWRNIGSIAATASITDRVIAPSQHDGYTNGDIRFIKNIPGAIGSLSFLPMNSAVLQNDVTPETYLNVQCSAGQVGQDAYCIQYPIALHVATLQNRPATIVFHGRNVSGSPNNYVDIQIYQFLGTGAISQPAPVDKMRVVLNSEFQRTTIPIILPDASNLVLGQGGDDALFLRIQFPKNAIFNIDHTKPQIYLSPDVPDNNFDTYDEIEGIINSPRTGDYKTSLNSFQPYGYVPANDGSIGSMNSNANTRANNDTWPLYNLLYTSILDMWCPVSGGGRSGNTTAAAYADFIANKTLTLTRNLGRVIAGLDPVVTPMTFTTNYGASHFDITIASSTGLTTGSPVQFIGGPLPGGISAGTVYFLIFVNSTTVRVADTLELAYNGSARDLLSNGTGTILNALGSFVGESLHTLTIPEMPNHNHTTATPNYASWQDNPGTVQGGGTIDLVRLAWPPTGFTGGGLPHNNVPPTINANVFIKL